MHGPRKPQRSNNRPPMVDAAGHDSDEVARTKPDIVGVAPITPCTNGGRNVLCPYSAKPINTPPSVLMPIARRPKSHSGTSGSGARRSCHTKMGISATATP